MINATYFLMITIDTYHRRIPLDLKDCLTKTEIYLNKIKSTKKKIGKNQALFLHELSFFDESLIFRKTVSNQDLLFWYDVNVCCKVRVRIRKIHFWTYCSFQIWGYSCIQNLQYYMSTLLSREDTVYVNVMLFYVNVIKIIFELHSICFKPHLN